MTQKLTKQQYQDLLVVSALDGTMPGWDGQAKMCVYSDEAGHHCAVGILNPTLLHKYELDPFNTIPFEVAKQVTPLGMSMVAINEIQKAHDDIAASCVSRQDFPFLFLRRLREKEIFADCNLAMRCVNKREDL